jgi:hypothetical protein
LKHLKAELETGRRPEAFDAYWRPEPNA